MCHVSESVKSCRQIIDWVTPNRIFGVFQLCLNLSAELLSWLRRPSLVLSTSVNRPLHGSSKIVWTGPYMYPPYPRTIFFFFFFSSKFSVFKFLRIFFVFVNKGPCGSKSLKKYSPLQFSSDFEPNCVINTHVRWSQGNKKL